MFDMLTHPVPAALTTAHAELDELGEVTMFGLTDEQLTAEQVSLARLAHRVAELELRMIAESESRGLDTKTTLVRASGQNQDVAHHRILLARRLAGHEPTRCAMGAGQVSEKQADAIVTAVSAIPTHRADIAVDVPARAEQALLGLSADHTPRELAVLGRRILHVVAPDVADAVLGEQVQAEHDRAQQTCRLTLTDDGHGRTYLRGHVTAPVGAMLRRNLQALMAPKHVRGSGQDHALLRRPGPERLGHAFCEYVERYPTDALPRAGGVQARAVVTLDQQQLTDALHASGVATIDGVALPAGEARRLACEAGILPMVLGGGSVPLDLGRSHRFHDTGQRLVVEQRDKTCTSDGCDWPAHLCHVHHQTPWSRGGHTTVADARLLCPRHHQLAHHPKWEMTKSKHGRVSFLRR